VTLNDEGHVFSLKYPIAFIAPLTNTAAKFEPPLGMPSVFDPSYKGVGQRAGLEIWRVEKLKVIKKAPTDQAYEGQLHEGDAYIILNTKVGKHALLSFLPFFHHATSPFIYP
jgi:hypothetical protein